jgi:hypothetical protein
VPLTSTIAQDLTAAFAEDASFANTAVWLSLHSANPGPTGANEVTSGVGASGRQLITFSGSSGVDTNSSALAIDVSAASVTWIGYWTAQTGGTFLGGFPLVGALSGIASISGSPNIEWPSHGRSVNDPVRMYAIPAIVTAVPGGFGTDVTYYVKTVVDSNTVVLSATIGGAAINASSSAVAAAGLDQSVVIAGTGTLTLPMSTGLTYQTV